MKALGKLYKDAEASGGGDFERLPAGGYVVRITAVTDVPAKEYLDVVFDIAEGERKGFYSDEWGASHPFAHHIILSYKETALGMFKGRLKAIDESNHTNFTETAEVGLNEQALVGKLVGAIIGYEEYESNQGDVRERSYVKQLVSTEKIRGGAFKIPEVKRLANKPAATTPPVAAPEGFSWDASDTPF